MELLIVTGLSGAGKSGTINALEDIGFYCIDNIPPQLISDFCRIISESGQIKRVAIVSDARGGSLFTHLAESVNTLREDPDIELSVMFLDASDEVLIDRYKETRRKHPLDDQCQGSLQLAIETERSILEPVRDTCDYYIDTTDFSLNQLKEYVSTMFLERSGDKLTVKFMSFGFKYGAAREADIVFDVRCLPNPFYVPELRPKTGLEAEIRNYVMDSPDSVTFEDKVRDMLEFLIPMYIREGKTQLVVAFGCTGGRHRSVTFAVRTYDYFTSLGYNTRISHRDIGRKG